MMQALNRNNITTDSISLPGAGSKNISLSVLRIDKIHPVISGNKWFKLRYHLEDVRLQHQQKVVTMGGAWSNHIVATAAACKINGLKSIGIIRGEEPQNLSATLLQAIEYGMQLIFISREDYKLKKIPAPFNNRDEYYFIDEGGYGIKGMTGAATILDQADKNQYTHICCALGTGTMMAGLISRSLPGQSVVGISVLKNKPEPENNIRQLLNDKSDNFHVNYDYHFGGYARYQPELIDFMNEFYRQTTIPSDFVYTGKLFFAIDDLVKKDFFSAGSKLLLIHSGGLQGNASLSKGTLIF